MPGRPEEWLSQRLPGGVLRPPARGTHGFGRLSTLITRSWPAYSTCTSIAATNRPWTMAEKMAGWAARLAPEHQRRAHAAHLADRIRRHGRSSLQPVCGNGQGGSIWRWRNGSKRSNSSIPWPATAMNSKGLHANTHIPQVIAAARRYEVTGDRRYHDIADYFWNEVVSERSYCTGGTSNHESWNTDPENWPTNSVPARPKSAAAPTT